MRLPNRLRTRMIALFTLIGTALLAACAPRATLAAEPGSEPNASPAGDLRFEVVLSERQLYVYVDDDVVETHPVSVGQPGHETITGEYGIHRVDWNPDWTPPDSDWAADAEYKAPGEPGNPMGRARLVFRAPYTIHGTEDLESLGRAESHGSIRIANDVVTELARMIMEYGGAARSEDWYEEALATPTRMRQVSIPDPVPIRIRD